MVPDYYAVLGVERDARPAQIKQKYFELAKQMHPDKHHGSDIEQGAGKAFEHLQKAYKTLSHPRQREAYDATLEETPAAVLQQGPAVLRGPSWLHARIEPVRPNLLATACSLSGQWKSQWRLQKKRLRPTLAIVGPIFGLAGIFVIFRAMPAGMLYLLGEEEQDGNPKPQRSSQ
mmetsp:Transcript_13206/g.25482  ORF Transcript_13206/g.25482 Transcript_13206/m.25482 type:complete len:174 (+) Transcript_13206:64-585(+)